MICVRFLVSGHVQGVFFRASTRERARELGVTGYARNLEDGRVEVLACGNKVAIEKLGQWLHRGPSAARVQSVERTTPPTLDEPPTAFAID